MIGIVIITHGEMSKILRETAGLIMGEQKELVAITFSARESVDTLCQKATEAIQPFQAGGCLLLTDVLGGSATNICVEFLKTEWLRIITGVNLPMVMEALNYRTTLDLISLTKKVRDAGIRGIIDLKEFYEQRTKAKKPA